VIPHSAKTSTFAHVHVQHTLAKRGAELWRMNAGRQFVNPPPDRNQAVQHVKAGVPAIYLSGWQSRRCQRLAAISPTIAPVLPSDMGSASHAPAPPTNQWMRRREVDITRRSRDAEPASAACSTPELIRDDRRRAAGCIRDHSPP